MKNFRFSVYGRISVRLTGVLHIGGEPEDDAITEKDAVALARDGDGRYIIPATGVAGVVRHIMEELASEASEEQKKETDEMLSFFGDNGGQENRIYFYDGSCEHVMLERRVESRMDHAMGTAEEGGLHAKVYIAPGMTAVFPVQIFAEDAESLAAAIKLMQVIAGALDSGRMKLGAGTTHGAGTFSVQGGSFRSLDLQNSDDLDIYLEGLDDLFTGQGEGWKPLAWEKIAEPDQFILTVDAPEGILVKSYDRTDIADAVNVSYCTADDDTLHYYIPGTSFKGVLRTGAEKIWSSLHLPAEDLEKIFGSSPDSQDTKQKSHIYVRDTEIPEPVQYIHNRIRIDRWLGGVMTGAKMNEQLIYPSEKHPMRFCAAVADGLPDRLSKEAEAVLFLLLRDIGAGRLTFGSGSSIGFGRCRGIELQWNGKKMAFRNGEICCDEDTNKELQTLLTSLQSQEESE